MSRTEHGHDHDAVDRLLPWYVNDTLDPAERDLVERHVHECASCRDSIALLTEMQDVVRHESPTPLIPAPRVEEFLQSLDREASSPVRRRRRLPLAVAASVCLLAVAALLLLTTRSANEVTPSPFETATSGGQSAAMDYVFDVVFEDGIDDARRNRVLEAIGAMTAVETGAPGQYRVTVRLPASLADFEQFAADVGARTEIRSVDVVAAGTPRE